MFKTCKICGINKSTKDFYSTSGLTCRKCKNKLDAERIKDNKNTTISILYEILNNQKKTEDTLLSRLDDMETEINKLRKKLNKIST
jgi:recombinational DNA repair protein (RecF pathway)